MNLADVKSITIPEGKVIQIAFGSTVIWKLAESSGPAYTNLLPTATDTDRKTIYQGVGYVTGKRLSSSGSVSTLTGMCASGFIPAKSGDVLRIKGATPKSGTASYVITYNSSNTKIAHQGLGQTSGTNPTWSATSTTASQTYKDGILTITLDSKYGTGFDAVRFSAGVIDGNTIVTINQEITE